MHLILGRNPRQRDRIQAHRIGIRSHHQINQRSQLIVQAVLWGCRQSLIEVVAVTELRAHKVENLAGGSAREKNPSLLCSLLPLAAREDYRQRKKRSESRSLFISNIQL